MGSPAGVRLPTLLYSLSPRLVILVHGPVAPSNADWEAYLDALAALKSKTDTIEDAGLLVVTDGANPSASQREAMNTRFPIKIRVAVVTASVVARGAVTIVSWFNPLIRAFTPTEFGDALRYLGVDPARYVEIRGRVADMRLELATGVAGQQSIGDATVPQLDAVVTRLSKLREDLERRRAR
jgi:hypothetical protein